MKVLDILNATRLTNDYLKSRIPVATLNNFKDIGNTLVNDERLTNMFFENLHSVIFMQEIIARSYDTPTKRFRSGKQIPNGLDLQKLYVNPATDEQFDKTGASLMNKRTSDVKQMFLKRNRQSKYVCSTSPEQIADAFTSLAGIESLINAQLMSLTNGDEIDEFTLVKALFNDILDLGLVNVIEVDAKPTDTATASAYIKACKKLYKAFKVPSSLYNCYANAYPDDTTPAVTWVSKPENIVHVITNDVSAECEVEVLSHAFNVEYTKMSENIIEIDSFGDNACIGMVMDETAVDIRENLMRIKQFENGDGLFLNIFRHHWQTIGICLFSNLVAVCYKVSMTKSDGTFNLVAGSQTKYLQTTTTAVSTTYDLASKITVTPSSEQAFVRYESSNTAIATVSSAGLVTKVATGDCNITVTVGGYKKYIIPVHCS